MAVSFEEALEQAREWLPNADEYTEMENAYIFSNKAAKMSFGGSDMPVVIMKETGERMGISIYYDEFCKDAKEIACGQIC